MNEVMLIGRLTYDPEAVPSETAGIICRMRIAFTDRKDKTHFFRVVAFGKQAESCINNLSKGDLIGIVGRLEQNTWQDKEGNKRESVGIVATHVDFLRVKSFRRNDDENVEA